MIQVSTCGGVGDDSSESLSLESLNLLNDVCGVYLKQMHNFFGDTDVHMIYILFRL